MDSDEAPEEKKPKREGRASKRGAPRAPKRDEDARPSLATHAVWTGLNAGGLI